MNIQRSKKNMYVHKIVTYFRRRMPARMYIKYRAKMRIVVKITIKQKCKRMYDIFIQKFIWTTTNFKMYS